MKKLHYASILASFTWGLVGLITLGSIYLSTIGWAINVVIGMLFLLFAGYIFFKTRNFLTLLRSVENVGSQKLALKRVITFEMIPILFYLMLGAMALFAVSERVFGEGFAVFG